MVLIEDSIWGFMPQYILDTKTLALQDKHDIFFCELSFLCSCFDSSPRVKFHQACVLVAIIGYKIMIFCFVQGYACSLCFRYLATIGIDWSKQTHKPLSYLLCLFMCICVDTVHMVLGILFHPGIYMFHVLFDVWQPLESTDHATPLVVKLLCVSLTYVY